MYRVETGGEAMEQIAELPNEALAHYAQVLGVLELTPWNGTPYNRSNPDSPSRQFLFGPHGEGMAVYLVLGYRRASTCCACSGGPDPRLGTSRGVGRGRSCGGC
ncbi:hypothetical protein SAMN04489726_3986 [Allokutzneria albata]|uniref:Uncharacterized protein n=1 Tax=Allokutzneria albata TaxID=211114 RepID=A0A1G9X4I6_ALLAB|nr:hypothetical protein SAMN04489726_3986 [Allokutzneria albata]